MNKKHVVFGKVIEGQDVIKALEVIGNDDGKTSKKAVIVSCGTIDWEKMINKKSYKVKINKKQKYFFYNILTNKIR